MPPKAKSNTRPAELKVAKRGNAKTAPAQRQSSGSTKPPAPAGPPAGQEQQAPRSTPAEPPAQSRTASSGSARKVSDGLKQLPQAAYSFVRESYLMLDSEGTGSVSKATMKDMLASLGLRDENDKRIDAMLERTGEPITFASYLAVMGELLGDLPTREELDMMLEAFQRKDGSIDERDMREALMEEGLKPAEIDAVIARFAKPTRQGQSFDVKKFASAMSI